MSNGSSHTYLASEFPLEYTKMQENNHKRLLLAHKVIGEATSAKALGIEYPILVDSEDIEYTIENATKFAQSKGLDPSCLIKVLKGTRKSHKGFKLKDSKSEVKHYKKEYPILVSPENKEIEINTPSLAEFARQNGINTSSLSGLINGRIKQTNGWRLKILS